MRNTNGSTSRQAAQAATTSSANSSTLDIEQLAAKVYQLILKDARLEQARGATRQARK
jgi:hypothetical protein